VVQALRFREAFAEEAVNLGQNWTHGKMPSAAGGGRRRPGRVMPFRDRTEAGRRLAERLAGRLSPGRVSVHGPTIVLGMPRGGIPVAHEIAKALRLPLDVLVVRKLGYPGQPELGLGAIGEGGVRVINERLVAQLRVPSSVLDQVARGEGEELERRLRTYRDGRPPVPVSGSTVVIVDDGLATGFTAMAGIEVLRRRGVSRIVLAIPVAPPSTVALMRSLADDVVCLEQPNDFFGIGEWYSDFHQVPDEEVRSLLADIADISEVPDASSGSGSGTFAVQKTFAIDFDATTLYADVTAPDNAHGVVVFAHGSGSSRLSPRNRFVAAALQDRGFATVLLDLLTVDEANERSNVFDVTLLSKRLESAVKWTAQQPDLQLPTGLFGASTGAAAALEVAASLRGEVGAVVSRGGRPDLAGARLPEVTAPTLLIVGGRDYHVLELNRRALELFKIEKRLDVIPGSGHLFEEPGALEQVADLANEWFISHLS